MRLPGSTPLGIGQPSALENMEKMTLASKKQADCDTGNVYSGEQCWEPGLGIQGRYCQITAGLPWKKEQ